MTTDLALRTGSPSVAFTRREACDVARDRSWMRSLSTDDLLKSAPCPHTTAAKAFKQLHKMTHAFCGMGEFILVCFHYTGYARFIDRGFGHDDKEISYCAWFAIALAKNGQIDSAHVCSSQMSAAHWLDSGISSDRQSQQQSKSVHKMTRRHAMDQKRKCNNRSSFNATLVWLPCSGDDDKSAGTF